MLDYYNCLSFDVLKINLFSDENVCFFGICYHCKKEDPVCGRGKWMEGSVILWLPNHFVLKKYRHPWQRTYTSKLALYDRFCCNSMSYLSLFDLSCQ